MVTRQQRRTEPHTRLVLQEGDFDAGAARLAPERPPEDAPEDEPLECVVVRSDNEAVVVNLDIEPVEKPESVAWVDPIHKAPD